MENRICSLETVPLALPERAILARLGFNRHLTRLEGAQREDIFRRIRRAFALCTPRGRCCRIGLAANDGETVVTSDGRRFTSARLAALLHGSHALWVAAGTVGDGISEAARRAAAAGDAAEAAICDAVGSESADAILDFLQPYTAQQLRRGGETLTERRFSPGYGGLSLETQRDIFELLNLPEWGMSLSANFFMTPEKSVTAFAGIRPLNPQDH